MSATKFGRYILIASLLVAPSAYSRAAETPAHPQPITVVMIDDRFQPEHLTFQHGQTYELRLENRGKEMHEFTAPAFFKASTVRDRHVLSNGGSEIVVQPNKSVRVVLQPRVKGDYKLTCADHDWDGMVGMITVD
jgi:uncharacterized cupredoxin-like copper-binding protein